MRVVAIDPGPAKSAICHAWVDAKKACSVTRGACPVMAEYVANDAALSTVRWNSWHPDLYVIERMITSYGRGGRVGAETFDTQFWVGKFAAAAEFAEVPVRFVTPLDRRLAVLGTHRGTDADIRDALIHAYGGKEVAFGVKCKRCKGSGVVGKKMAPCDCPHWGWIVPKGPLHGWTGTHVFSALACAIAALGPLSKGGDR